MSSTSTIEMSKSEWLAARNKGIGGSDAAAVCGVSKYKTPLQLWQEKTGRVQPADIGENSRVRAGNALEEVVAAWWQEETGMACRRDNKIRAAKDRPYLLANVDRVIQSNGDGPGILEIKTTSGWAMKAVREEGLTVPMTWWCQLQHYFHVTGYAWGAFGVLMDGHEFEHIPVSRDDDFISALVEREIEFWERHVLADVPPEPVAESDILSLYPRSQANAVEASAELAAQVRQLKEIKASISALEKEEANLSEAVKLALGGNDTLTADGKVIATWKSSKDGERFNARRFEAENPELFRQYFETVPGSRRFLVK